ncbi:WXG100 family type VII secretion target [Amycolatopsis sp. NPDC023774]|uniref:WXG100 family type VII secretion target n=1 Tax=Amycolatopsis sp. NPDC023774 TaxID=3155015 RepID=UPI00340A9F9D
MGRILVDPATIYQAAEDCATAGTQLGAQFDQLKSDLNPLINSWSGEAQRQYMDAQAQWDQSFDDLKALLAQLTKALPEIADGYQRTDKDVTNLFQK